MKLYVIETGKPNPLQLTDDTLNVESFAWHPDSGQIAYSLYDANEQGERSRIFIASIDDKTSVPIQFEQEANRIYNLAWSPKGDELSFMGAFEHGPYELYIANVIGTDILTIAPYNSVSNGYWSPDGSRIALIEFQSLVIENPADEIRLELARLPSRGEQFISSASWSPDGQYIAYTSNASFRDQFSNSSIHIVAVDGSGDLQITDAAARYSNPAWSPAGNMLVISKCDENECGIYRASPDGSSMEEIISGLGTSVDDLIWLDHPQASIHPSFVALPSEPLEPWDPFPVPALYDDFESANLNNQLWRLGDEKSLEHFSYAQSNGLLRIISKGSVQSGGLDVFLGSPRSISNLDTFEASLKISQASKGFAFVKIQIVAKLPDHEWSTQCRAGGSLRNQPSFVCDVAVILNDQYSIVFQTKDVPIHFDQWYPVRIEINPDQGALQFYLDDQIIDTYLPRDAKALTSDTYLKPSVGVFVANGSIVSYIDDVRITGGTSALREMNLIPFLFHDQTSYEDGTLVVNNSYNDWYGFESWDSAITLTTPFRVTLQFDKKRGESASISLSGRLSQESKEWWEGIHRMYIWDNPSELAIEIRDGKHETSYKWISIGEGKNSNNPFSIEFNDPQGKSFSIINSESNVIRTVDVTKLGGIDLPDGLFPDKVLYPGFLLSPRAELEVSLFSFLTLSD